MSLEERQAQLSRIKIMQFHARNQPDSRQATRIELNSEGMGAFYEDLPIIGPHDLGFLGEKPASLIAYESACRDGPVSTVQSLISAGDHTPVTLHHGLAIALRAGNIDVARHLLSTARAPICRMTANNILCAPAAQQIPLFELLAHHGWMPNSPGYYGAVLLLRVVTDVALVRWFLDHGADPNLGEQGHRTDRHGAPERDSCAILEAAAAKCDVEVVRLLLDAGAKIPTGFPLHRAAGAAPNSVNQFVSPVTISKEDDRSRIPVMALLVERGADLNQEERAKQLMPGYPIMEAAMVGAVERVRWLLEHGANPEATGGWGNAVQRASRDGNEEMQRVITEGLAARRWMKEAKQ